MAKKKSSSTAKGTASIIAVVCSALAAVVFCLPQFTRTVIRKLEVNGFELSFGFKDITDISGKPIFFISFIVGILVAVLVLATILAKSARKNGRMIHAIGALLSVAAVVCIVITLTTIRDITYFKAILDVTKNGKFTLWIYAGIALHSLSAISCAYRAFVR